MCGIVGYIGNRQAYPILIKGLRRLEYRGYDSSGVALVGEEGELKVYKSKGKIDNLEAFSADKDVTGTIGIAHTRWATHGEPSDMNAHPHYSQTKDLALIHNGIIENYSTIKKNLINNGYTFRSETDTEVLVQFIEYIKKENKVDLLTAVQLALTQVIGAYAIGIVERNNPDQIIVARKSSPLVVGIGENEYFIGSDASPIVEFTDKVVYLEDDEIAVLDRYKGVRFCTISNVAKTHEIKKLETTLDELEKNGYPHFMLKEIYEQPNKLIDSMKGRISVDNHTVSLSGVIDNKEKFLNANRIIIVACGTSWHAGLIGEFLFEELVRIPVEVEYASEFRYRDPVITSNDVVIAISQSGETADTLAAIDLAHSKGAFVYGICNVVGSSISRVSDSGSYTHVGPEIGVASTKAFTAQVTVLSLMALELGRLKGSITEGRFNHLVNELCSVPAKIEEILKNNKEIEQYSKIFTYAKNFIYLGRKYTYPVALEGALKLKEISYIHAEGYPAAEMKHGPIALIDEEMPTVVIATDSDIYEKVISNIQEIKARNGRIIAIVSEDDTVVKNIADFVISIPKIEECFAPLLTIIPLQLFSYYIAIEKGRDVDQPRNLAKSVTVE